jgi:hypothetical protein
VLRLPRGDPRLRPPMWTGMGLAIPLMSGIPGLILVCVVAVLMLGWFVMVICPAVWSKNETRRQDAKDVLRIFRKRR